MSELFFAIWRQRIGINVYLGVDVDFDSKRSTTEPDLEIPKLFNHLHTPRVLLNDPSRATRNGDTKLVCVAPGSQRKLTSMFGGKEKMGTWSCDAYWTYFRRKIIVLWKIAWTIGTFLGPSTYASLRAVDGLLT